MSLSTLSETDRLEFEQHEQTINTGLDAYWKVGAALLAIRDKRLYREHYSSYAEYCQKRWGFTDSRARQLAAAAEIHEEVKSATNVTLDNEAQARAVNALPKSVQADAVTNAAANGKVTAATIQQEGEKLIVERTPDQVARDAVLASKYSPVILKLKMGVLSPQKALLLVDALKACKPQVRGDMMRLNISEPTVIRMLNERWKSETYKEIARTGYLQFDDERAMKAEHITAEHLREFLDARAREHRTRGYSDAQEKRGVQIVPVNIYRGDARKTADVLLRELAIEDIVEIVGLLEAKLKAAQAA